MKKFMAVISIVSMVLLLTCCGEKKNTVNENSSTNGISSEESVSSSKTTSEASSSEVSSSEEVSSSAVSSESNASVSSASVSSEQTKSITSSSAQTSSKTQTSSSAQTSKPGTASSAKTPAASSSTSADKKVMPTSASPVGASDMEVKIFNLINAERQKGGVAALKWSSELYSGAKLRAKEAVTYYSHYRPDGTRFNTAFTNIVNKYTCAQKQDYIIGENLSQVTDIQEYSVDEICDLIVTYWINSPSHHANFMNRKTDEATGRIALYTTTAISVYSPDNGKSYYVEQVFGDFLVS